jgi:hypothetical protein
MDLERELRALPIEWPATPKLRLELARRRRRWPLVVAIALAAVAAAFAVPQSRGAILRFFHLGAATIVQVDTLPPAADRPLAAGLGPVVTLAKAHQALGSLPLLVPPLDPLPDAHVRAGDAVSFVFTYHGQPVLLSEFPVGPGFLKKFTAGGTSIEEAGFDGFPGFWVSGAVHDVFFPGSSPRLADNVLLWERAGGTYRLESHSLTKAETISLARTLTPG